MPIFYLICLQNTDSFIIIECSMKINILYKYYYVYRKSRPADLTNEEQAVVDKSFTLNEADLAIGTIAEQIPSPTSSVHVDMQEYNSSSYEDR